MARKPKATRATAASATVAEPELPVLNAAPAPARRGRPRKAAPTAPSMQEDSSDAIMGVADTDLVIGSDLPNNTDGTEQNAAESEPADGTAAPPAVLDAATTSKPAAQWDRTTDTAHFDWPEIERTASQQGPNQVMAKLLIAARAEGANSRWPF